MRRKVFIYLSALFICIFIFSCKCNKNTDDLEKISIENAYHKATSIFASDYFDDIRYVILETTEESLIGNNPNVYLAKDKIIIISDKQCSTFDKNTGKFICNIGHIGNDPEGSISLLGWFNEASSQIYFPKGNRRNVIYNCDGIFIGNQSDPDFTDGFYGVDNYDYFDSEKLVMHLPATANKLDRIYIYKDTTVVSYFPSMGDDKSKLSAHMDNIQDIKTFNLPNTEREVINITYKDGLQSGFIPSEQVFWHHDKKLYFRELFNDTIYEVGLTGLKPVKCFDFGSLKWERDERYNAKNKNTIYPLDIFDNENVLWLRFVVNLYHKEDMEVYNAIYDKKKGVTTISPFEEGLKDDLNNFIPLQPSSSTSTGEFVQIASVEDIKMWFDKHPEQKDYPSEISKLRYLSEEDNPVVIILK